MEMEDFKNKFIEDAIELVSKLESVLLDLENSPQDKELIQEVFRVMHTLKGVSGMYGFENIAQYTHQLESVYDYIRNGQLAVSKKILDITLASVDHLLRLLKDEEFTDPTNISNQQNLLGNIAEVIVSAGFELPKTIQAKTEKKAKDTNDDKLKTYYILFEPDDSYFYRGINLSEIFDELSQLGEYQIVEHKISFFDSSESEQSDVKWGIYLVSRKGIDAVEEVFMFILDNCKILRYADTNIFDEVEVDRYIDRRLLNVEKILTMDDISNQEFDLNPIKDEDDLETAALKRINEELYKIKTPENQDEHTEPSHFPNQQKDISESKTDNESLKNLGKLITSRIYVYSTKLDYLMYLVSELVTTRAQLGTISETKSYGTLDEIVEKIDKLSKNFRDNALSIRLVPVNDMVIRFKRLIRDLSQSLNKEVRFITQGTETELDKNIIDTIVEPIMHIIRNCIDHGIEAPEIREAQGKPREGVIKLTSFNSGTNVFIQIQDDGGGINHHKVLEKAIEKGFVQPETKLSRREIYNLIFLPGFSTAQSLTGVSGRGVGMDVVRKKIAEVRGEVDVDSEIGLGTSFTLKLQQTVSIIDTLLVKSGLCYFMIPLSEVEVCDQKSYIELFKTNNKLIEYDNDLVPFVHLHETFKFKTNQPKDEKIIFVNRNEYKFAIVVDSILGEYQAVLKPMGYVFKKQEFLSGASILGDGNIALMLDTKRLLDYSMGNEIALK